MRKEGVYLSIILVLILAGCEQQQKTGSGFVGGKEGVTLKFLTDAPPTEVYDNNQFPFEVAVQLQNKGEYTVKKENLKVELSGISSQEFAGEYKKFNSYDLKKTYRDSTGSTVAGDTEHIYFKKFNYKPEIKGSAIPFTIRADLCYHYNTDAVTKLCIKKQFTVPGEEQVCNVNEAKTIDVSGAPVQITNFKEMPGGGNRVAFSFEIQHTGAGAVYKHFAGGDALCLGAVTEPGEKLQFMNRINVKVETGMGEGPVCSSLTSEERKSGMSRGDVHLYEGKRIITCYQDITAADHAYEKPVTITLEYDYKQHIETPITVKHIGGVE